MLNILICQYINSVLLCWHKVGIDLGLQTFCSISDRAGSISTLDSLDFARYSDDGNRETDERVAG